MKVIIMPEPLKLSLLNFNRNFKKSLRLPQPV